MSKASKYADHVMDALKERPALHLRSEYINYGSVQVDNSGFLDVGWLKNNLPPEAALELTAWIIDTFGGNEWRPKTTP